MKLSANFNLSELIKSQTAIRHGIPNEPNADQIDNLKAFMYKRIATHKIRI